MTTTPPSLTLPATLVILVVSGWAVLTSPQVPPPVRVDESGFVEIGERQTGSSAIRLDAAQPVQTVTKAAPGAASSDSTLRGRALELTRATIDVHSHDPFKPISPRFPQQITLALVARRAVGGLVAAVPFSQLPSEHPFDTILADLQSVRARLQDEGGPTPALRAADLGRAAQRGRPAIMLSIEYFQGPLEGRVETLDSYYREGVRVFGLSHGGKDAVTQGDGATRGLSEFGRQAVAAMNRLGMAVDVTHLPPGVRRQVIEASVAPVLVSHTAAAVLVPSEFNLDDETLALLAARDGLVGVTFCSEQLSKATSAAKATVQDPSRLPPARVEELVEQIDYLRRRIGIEHVALGSDYGGSGRMAPAGLETVEGLPVVAYEMLKRGYTEGDVKQVLGGNFIRYLERVETIPHHGVAR
jgi:membrane dipeptidase